VWKEREKDRQRKDVCVGGSDSEGGRMERERERDCDTNNMQCTWKRILFLFYLSCFLSFTLICPGIEALPLYVGACPVILCHETDEYEKRAWTRVERVMSFAYSQSAITFSIKTGFIHRYSFHPTWKKCNSKGCLLCRVCFANET
jgi:hypothetical protein